MFAYQFFIHEKHPKHRRNRVARASVYWNKAQPPAIDRQRNRWKGVLTPSQLGAIDPSYSDNLNGDGGVCACVRDVFAIYGNILPGW